VKLALVHDYLVQDGGAEKVLKEMMEVFPDAPTYVLLHDPARVDPAFSRRKILTSFLQRLPFALTKYQWLLPLMPIATETHDLSEFDVVLSSSSAFSKGVITKPDALHICYCHTPTRYLWSDAVSYVRELRMPGFVKAMLPPLLSRLRMWDKQAAERVELFLANSEAVRRRIKKYYHRESIVVYPPVDVARFRYSHAPKEYYLAGGRLVSYKRYDIIIEACNRLKLPLKIFGSGPVEAELKAMAGPTIEFLGRVSDEKQAELYQNCIAFINPQEEDFGITMVEALAAGRPVIAYNRGGATEIVIEGVNGTFFNEQTWEDLADALLRFDHTKFDPKVIQASAKRFSTQAFHETIKQIVDKAFEKQCVRCELP
jgi:glycosyltransferase involved in cell wall biosynthesis